MKMKRLLPVVALASVISLLPGRALAVPMLQLDIAGGTYDEETETILSPSTTFRLHAVGTPKDIPSALTLLFDTFYISAALIPVNPELGSVTPPGGDFGSFVFNGAVVNATSDMTYGTPPIELFGSMQGHDGGDLPSHGVFPTYFSQFDFKFSLDDRTLTYNTADDPGGLTPSFLGTSLFREFLVDTSNLNPNYVLHFDLYNADVLACSKRISIASCADVDADKFAPFSHDAQSSNTPPPVPEPATLLLMGSGLAAGAVRRFRQSLR